MRAATCLDWSVLISTLCSVVIKEMFSSEENTVFQKRCDQNIFLSGEPTSSYYFKQTFPSA